MSAKCIHCRAPWCLIDTWGAVYKTTALTTNWPSPWSGNVLWTNRYIDDLWKRMGFRYQCTVMRICAVALIGRSRSTDRGWFSVAAQWLWISFGFLIGFLALCTLALFRCYFCGSRFQVTYCPCRYPDHGSLCSPIRFLSPGCQSCPHTLG